MNEINLVLSAKKILSVNALYRAMMVNKGGKSFATIYKTKEAKLAEAWISDQIRALDIPKNYPWVTKDTLFSYSINVIFKNGFLSRDIDNVLKNMQDGIFRALDINDSHVVQIFAKKSYMPDISEEKICISLREFKNKEELRVDYIPSPALIWSDSSRVDELGLKEYKGRKMKNQLYRVAEEDLADTKIFVIEDLDYLTLGNIYLKLTEALFSSSGLYYIVILGNESDYGKEKWDALLEFSRKVKEMSDQYSGIRLKNCQGMDEVKTWIRE